MPAAASSSPTAALRACLDAIDLAVEQQPMYRRATIRTRTVAVARDLATGAAGPGARDLLEEAAAVVDDLGRTGAYRHQMLHRHLAGLDKLRGARGLSHRGAVTHRMLDVFPWARTLPLPADSADLVDRLLYDCPEYRETFPRAPLNPAEERAAARLAADQVWLLLPRGGPDHAVRGAATDFDPFRPDLVRLSGYLVWSLSWPTAPTASFLATHPRPVAEAALALADTPADAAGMLESVAAAMLPPMTRPPVAPFVSASGPPGWGR